VSRTCSERAHKLFLGAVLDLAILTKCWNCSSFHVPMFRVLWFEILRDFVGLPELYGLKYNNLITSVIVFVLVLL
jgi:hypothetical protein